VALALTAPCARSPACLPVLLQIFLTFFKTMLGKTIVVELKNDIKIQGVLESIDQFLNFKLNDITVLDAEKYPHLMTVRNCFIRGSVVRYVQVPASEVNTELLQDSCRKEQLKNNAD
jgi:U6 snRNA-associated Sm-like protein LSm2